MLPDKNPKPIGSDVIHYKNEYYIRAESSLADDRTQVLKHDQIFAVFDRNGDIHHVGQGEHGIYYYGTRFLSHLDLQLDSKRLILLDSEMKNDNVALAVDLTNPDYFKGDTLIYPKDNLHVFRWVMLWERNCYQRFQIKNYHDKPIKIELKFNYGADFVDIFEVRGMHRKQRGVMLSPEIKSSSVMLRYKGLDNVTRQTQLLFSKKPKKITEEEATLEIKLKPNESKEIALTIRCYSDKPKAKLISYETAHTKSQKELKATLKNSCDIFTSNEQFNDWINTSLVDMHMLLTQLDTGPYPYAGIPWFSTAFGRDGIIAALEMLWINPEIAKGVLSFLAETQAKEEDPSKDAEPGKILHETRRGEMANLGEIPFGLYYGSIDSTPLFVYLAEAYYQRTNDIGFIKKLWPSIEAALNWIEEYGDPDKDGLIEYSRRSDKGLTQQGWKDSHDSVFYKNGKIAKPAVALCEVQAYVYGAYIGAATLSEVLGKEEKAAKLKEKAASLKSIFHKKFWSEKIGTYVLALDGDKKPCHVKSSNAGQCLLTGIVDPEYAKRVAKNLFTDDMFSGWGVRTISSDEVRYNPLSYHNGSVWPHDNALIAKGLALYGLKEEAEKLLTSFFDASIYIESRRLPELFCGFPRRRAEGATPYPVACSPQAWAAGSSYLFLQSALGLKIDTPNNQVIISHPSLPSYLNFVEIKNLIVGDKKCDLSIQKKGDYVTVRVLDKDEGLNIVIEQ